jgi:hypothetical protein
MSTVRLSKYFLIIYRIKTKLLKFNIYIYIIKYDVIIFYQFLIIEFSKNGGNVLLANLIRQNHVVAHFKCP